MQGTLKSGELSHCLVQMSAALSEPLCTHIRALEEFIRENAVAYGPYIARALVYRVVESVPGEDRFCAWRLLHTAIKICCAEVQYQPLILDPLSERLAHTVLYRWEMKLGDGSLSPHCVEYKAMAKEWAALFNSVVMSRIYDAMKQAPHNLAVQEPDIPGISYSDKLLEAVWKLRREKPRPVGCLYIWRAYHNNRDVPVSEAALQKLGPMHPTAKRHLTTYVKAKYACHFCDSWEHDEANCDCKVCFICHKPGHTGARCPVSNHCVYCSGRDHDCLVCPQAMHICREKLASMRLEKPKPMDVLMHCWYKLRNNEGIEPIIMYFDGFRGATSGSNERRALATLSIYNLKPNSLIPTTTEEDAKCNAALGKLHTAMSQQRRFTEFDNIKQAVVVLKQTYFLEQLTPEQEKALKYLKDKKSFIFEWVEGKNAEKEIKHALFPKSVLHRLKIIRNATSLLCRRCLSTDPECHKTCHKMPLYDIQIAGEVFVTKGMHEVRPSEIKERIINEQTALVYNIENPHVEGGEWKEVEDHELVKVQEDGAYELARLNTAETIITGRFIKYCEFCKFWGHSKNSCMAFALDTLGRCDLTLNAVKWDPEICMKRAFEIKKKSQDDMYGEAEQDDRPFELNRAYAILRHSAYPSEYNRARNSLMTFNTKQFGYGRHHIDINAKGVSLVMAKYVPDLIDSFVRTAHCEPLLVDLAVIRSKGFPEICLNCGAAGEHRTYNCDEKRNGEPTLSVGVEELTYKMYKTGSTLDEVLKEREPPAWVLQCMKVNSIEVKGIDELRRMIQDMSSRIRRWIEDVQYDEAEAKKQGQDSGRLSQITEYMTIKTPVRSSQSSVHVADILPEKSSMLDLLGGDSMVPSAHSIIAASEPSLATPAAEAGNGGMNVISQEGPTAGGPAEPTGVEALSGVRPAETPQHEVPPILREGIAAQDAGRYDSRGGDLDRRDRRRSDSRDRRRHDSRDRRRDDSRDRRDYNEDRYRSRRDDSRGRQRERSPVREAPFDPYQVHGRSSGRSDPSQRDRPQRDRYDDHYDRNRDRDRQRDDHRNYPPNDSGDRGRNSSHDARPYDHREPPRGTNDGHSENPQRFGTGGRLAPATGMLGVRPVPVPVDLDEPSRKVYRTDAQH